VLVLSTLVLNVLQVITKLVTVVCLHLAPTRINYAFLVMIKNAINAIILHIQHLFGEDVIYAKLVMLWPTLLNTYAIILAFQTASTFGTLPAQLLTLPLHIVMNVLTDG